MPDPKQQPQPEEIEIEQPAPGPEEDPAVPQGEPDEYEQGDDDAA